MPNINQVRYSELLRAEEQLAELRIKTALIPAAEQFCRNMGMISALTPFTRWSDFQKACLADAFRGFAPDLKQLYIDRLPKQEIL